MKRKSFNTEFKAKVAIEAIKGHKTINELASEFEISPSQINSWKKLLLDGASDTFSRGKQKRTLQQADNARKRGCQQGSRTD